MFPVGFEVSLVTFMSEKASSFILMLVSAHQSGGLLELSLCSPQPLFLHSANTLWIHWHPFPLLCFTDFGHQEYLSSWVISVEMDMSCLVFCLLLSFKCRQMYHAPTDCATIRKWLTKCADDSETANYISAHTKDVRTSTGVSFHVL